MNARTIDEFMRSAPPKASVDAEMRHLHAFRQAAVSADKLTGDPDWDVFLTYVQSAIDKTEEQKRGFEDRLRSPEVVDHLEILKIKIALAECIAMINAWVAMINLPADIKKNGSKAKDLMERLGQLTA